MRTTDPCVVLVKVEPACGICCGNSQCTLISILMRSRFYRIFPTAAMFFLVVSCVWFGTSNSAR